MLKVIKFGLIFLFMVFVLSACFRQRPPEPTQPNEPPVTNETPLFTDTQIDNAGEDLGVEEGLEGTDEPDASEGTDIVGNAAAEGDFTAQAVLSGAKGFVVYIWNNPANANQPWRIYRHNEVTNANTLVYGGLREISSVAISGDGNTLLASMKETTDAASDFEVYQIVISPQTVTALTNNTGPDNNVSMAGNAGFYAWEGDGTTAGIRNVFLRNNTVSPVTTTRLSQTINQTQPSISNDGRFIAMMRRANNNYQVYLYNRVANSYSLQRNGSDVIEHPSVSNYGEKVAWLQKIGTTNRIFVRDIAANTNTQILSSSNLLDHPHLAADGNYLTFAQQISGVFNVYIRNLSTNQQVKAVNNTFNNTAPYWQFPAPVTQLVGSPTSPATAAVPNLDFVPRGRDYTTTHPTLTGKYISYNTILLAFKLNTTVGQANAILSEVGAEIVGGLTGVAGQSTGVLAVRLATSTQQQLINIVTTLNAKPEVEVAVQDSLLERNAISQVSTSLPTQWTWEISPATGNYGMEMIRAPQLWNLNEALKKSSFFAPIAVIDAGFAPNHPDLIYTNNQTPNQILSHGTQVAGIIGATFNNTIGVDGINPFAELYVRGRDNPTPALPNDPLQGRSSVGDVHINALLDLFLERSDIRVVNISLGYTWGGGFPPIDTSLQNNQTSEDARDLASRHGRIADITIGNISALINPIFTPIIVTSAGNDSNVFPTPQLARYNSPFTNAALEHNNQNIIVAEAVDVTGTRAGFSNVDGTLFAPGVCIWSTIDTPTFIPSPNCPAPIGQYGAESGTSFAAPHIAGLISYLIAIDADLTNQQIRDLLISNGRAVTAPLGASPRPYIDAYASALAIDGLRGNDRVLKMLLDIDDGTLDGNQRTLISSANTAGTTDANQDGVVDAALNSEQPLIITSTDFGSISSSAVVGEDVDSDGGVGDGVIDMSDFRRWRDWYVGANNFTGDLNGSSSHYKKDVNSHPKAGITPTVNNFEDIYARGDFNGSGGMANALATATVPGFANPVTDLEVIQQSGLWADLVYTVENLESLRESGDLEIWIRDLYTLPGVVSVQSYIEGDLIDGNVIHLPNRQRFVYTLAPGTYDAFIVALDEFNLPVVGLKKRFTITGNGQDLLWASLVELTGAPTTGYNGPVDDCQRLQGEYGVDIRGLWDGAVPDIDINSSSMNMYLNNSGFNTIEREKLTNMPLTVRARTIRHCNATEGNKQLGWEMNYKMGDAASPEGFYAYIFNPITIVDNRWPGLIWNQTNQTQGGTSCTGVPVNFTITSNRSGEANQNFNNVAIGARRNIRMRFDATYTVTSRTADANNQLLKQEQRTGPFGIDSKFTYRGQQAWFHIVLFREETDSQCGTNIQAPNLAAMSADDITQTFLFNQDQAQTLGERQGF